VIKIGLGGGDWTKKYKLELDRFFGEEIGSAFLKKKRIVLSWKILNTQIGAYVLRINTEKNILR